MPGPSSPPLSTLVLGAMGVAPAGLAAYLAPSPWSIAAAAGATVATTLLSMEGRRRSRELAQFEFRQQQLQVAVSTAEARVTAAEEKVREAATLDELTGTLNRRMFLTRLDEVIQRDVRLKKPMSFLLIDIDGFRRINAVAGRVIGDRVLRNVARAIQASTRGTDYVGRIGGDEFAVVLGECFDPRPAVDRVFVALHGETTGGDAPLPIGVSVGIVTFEDAPVGVDAVKLFRVAEDALASARGSGGGRCAKREYHAPAAR